MDYQNQIVREDMCELAKEHLPFEKLKGSSVLVTGASGMLATYMVYFFMYLNETRKYDINVTALVRNEKKAWEKFEGFCRFISVYGDIFFGSIREVFDL